MTSQKKNRIELATEDIEQWKTKILMWSQGMNEGGGNTTQWIAFAILATLGGLSWWIGLKTFARLCGILIALMAFSVIITIVKKIWRWISLP